MSYKHGVPLDPNLHIEDYDAGVRIRPDGSQLHVDIIYPRNGDKRITGVDIGLECVRAASDISVSYDFDRDGWKITQKICVGYKHDPAQNYMEEIEEDREVAFVPAWHPDDKDYEDCFPIEE